MSSEEVDKSKKNNTKRIIILVVFIAIVAGLIAFLINLFTERTTYTSTTSENTTTESLYCMTKSINIDGGFFDVSDAVAGSQAVKVIFKSNKIDNISYNASLTYESDEAAAKAFSDLQARYGTYVQDDGKKMEVFSPNFSLDEVNVRISLYAEKNKLDNKLAKIFLIDTSDTDLNSYTSRVLSTLYKSKGFSCESKG